MSVVWMSGKCHRGALALIVVVYVLAALGTFAFALAYRTKIGLCQAQLSIDRAQQDQMALAACAQACRLLARDDPNVDSQQDIWSGWHALAMPLEPTGRRLSGQVWWRLMDESARINVNLAPLDVLLRIEEIDQAAVASIMDWMDEDDIPNPDGAESEYYAGLSPGYACRNGPLESLEELVLVKGIIPECYFGTRQTVPLEDLSDLALEQDRTTEEEEGSVGLSELLTIYGDGKINLNTAQPGVLKALPFLSEAAVDEILSRQQPSARKFTTLQDIQANDTFSVTDKIVLQQVAKFNSSFFRIQVRIQLESMSSICEYAAILERDETEVRVLSWQRKLPHRSGNQDGAADPGQTAESVN
ncbi:MAG: type II secretion system minor pseudopilin [Planctomycetota bacterium]|jgi:general secretion pathway protein K